METQSQRLVCLSTNHLTDLDHIFICRATLDCFGDISNRRVYSNGHHLYWDSHRLPSQHCSVQNLRVLEKRRKERETERARDQHSNVPRSGRSLIHPITDNQWLLAQKKQKKWQYQVGLYWKWPKEAFHNHHSISDYWRNRCETQPLLGGRVMTDGSWLTRLCYSSYEFMFLSFEFDCASATVHLQSSLTSLGAFGLLETISSFKSATCSILLPLIF